MTREICLKTAVMSANVRYPPPGGGTFGRILPVANPLFDSAKAVFCLKTELSFGQMSGNVLLMS
jgi:hypothetical protein